MGIELDRALFRRLVQLYLLVFLLSFALLVWQVLDAPDGTFEWEFNDLVSRHYGWSEYPDWALGPTVLLILANLGAVAGLLWFKRWARWLFWVSMVAALPFNFVAGPPVVWSDQLNMLTNTIGSALFGIIVLLSYASGLGAIWFDSSAEAQQG